MDAFSLAFLIYSSQILLVVSTAALAEALFRVAKPAVRLGYWRAIGVLCLGSTRAAAYDEATVAHVQPLADSVALAFENVRLFQKTRELSISDEVTPLYNFRFFHQILERDHLVLVLAREHQRSPTFGRDNTGISPQ